jgi:hypothetical protein
MDYDILKLCNRCYEFFEDEGLSEYAHCPDCGKGDIIFITQIEWDLLHSERGLRRLYLESLVMKGSPNSRRAIRIHCSFTAKIDADGFVKEMQNQNICFGLWKVGGGRDTWEVTAYDIVTLNDMLSIINTINQTTVKYNPLPSDEWVRAHFEW